MAVKKILALNVLAMALVGCGGGDVIIGSSTTGGGSAGDTPTSGFSSQCASYTFEGEAQGGTYDGTNCSYAVGFVDLDNPLMVDVSIPNIGNGVHIFAGSLIVGQAYNTDADLAAAGIAEGGDGPTLTIASGSTLAFLSSDDYVVVNRGSQIRANGSQTQPITFTSQSDAVFNTVGPEDVSQWGGMVINGFGVTNKCAYTGTYPALTPTSECHVTAEGKAGAGESYYGGNNDDDSSGVLSYVIVKHTGAEVAPGNELNGIAFGAVGRGTTVENVEAYSTYDDGLEFFGGAVDVTNYVALYVRDDSIDIDEGYRGTITNALVIQSETDGNRCIESDGIGSYDDATSAGTVADSIARGLNSQATITNLTCIVSANETGTHDPGQGWRIREAHIPHISNSIVTTAFPPGDELTGDDDYNYCFRIEHEGGPAATAGDLVVESSVFACQDLIDGDLGPGDTLAWLRAGGNAAYQSAEAGEDPTAASNAALVILDGYYTVASGMTAGAEAIPAPTGGASYLGAVTAADDWTDGWTYGLQVGNRGKDLWFE